MEYELRISTAMPVPFQDAGSGTMVFAECQASAMVAPIDEAKYPDRDAINRLGVPTAQSLIAQVLMDLSGKIDALSLSDHKRDIEKNMVYISPLYYNKQRKKSGFSEEARCVWQYR